ncbi:MAG: hypothetical protein HY074_18650, partial [Deltaproteobacteria bacterium]|nr:hypothetical protein [Deltaproteobacteria bacterium]
MRRPFATAVLPLILAAAFISHMALTTTFWAETRRALSSDELSYSQRRSQYAFHGMPLEDLRLRLNDILANDTPVAISAQLAKDDFFVQRLTESIYPRIVDGNARNVLELGA